MRWQTVYTRQHTVTVEAQEVLIGRLPGGKRFAGSQLPHPVHRKLSWRKLGLSALEPSVAPW